MMLLSKPFESASLGFFIYLIQLVLFISIILDQTTNSNGESTLQVQTDIIGIPQSIQRNIVHGALIGRCLFAEGWDDAHSLR
mmetsp:Transcript_5191/g.7531  ORF Transcript_5191/g.7531 Transcript_5191/m.7531 type:complete len:82 (-) Transcript_5191:1361-1606(-)